MDGWWRDSLTGVCVCVRLCVCVCICMLTPQAQAFSCWCCEQRHALRWRAAVRACGVVVAVAAHCRVAELEVAALCTRSGMDGLGV